MLNKNNKNAHFALFPILGEKHSVFTIEYDVSSEIFIYVLNQV